VALDQSRLKGLVNTRSEAMADIGWDPEWEVNPKELKLIQRIGVCTVLSAAALIAGWVGGWGGVGGVVVLGKCRRFHSVPPLHLIQESSSPLHLSTPQRTPICLSQPRRW